MLLSRHFPFPELSSPRNQFSSPSSESSLSYTLTLFAGFDFMKKDEIRDTPICQVLSLSTQVGQAMQSLCALGSQHS